MADVALAARQRLDLRPIGIEAEHREPPLGEGESERQPDVPQPDHPHPRPPLGNARQQGGSIVGLETHEERAQLVRGATGLSQNLAPQASTPRGGVAVARRVVLYELGPVSLEDGRNPVYLRGTSAPSGEELDAVLHVFRGSSRD